MARGWPTGGYGFKLSVCETAAPTPTDPSRPSRVLGSCAGSCYPEQRSDELSPRVVSREAVGQSRDLLPWLEEKSGRRLTWPVDGDPSR